MRWAKSDRDQKHTTSNTCDFVKQVHDFHHNVYKQASGEFRAKPIRKNSPSLWTIHSAILVTQKSRHCHASILISKGPASNTLYPSISSFTNYACDRSIRPDDTSITQKIEIFPFTNVPTLLPTLNQRIVIGYMEKPSFQIPHILFAMKNLY